MAARTVRDAREVYVSSDITLSELARQFRGVPGCSRGALHDRKKREGWDEARDKRHTAAEQAARTRWAENRADMLARHYETAENIARLGKVIDGLVLKAVQAGGVGMTPDDLARLATAHSQSSRVILDAQRHQRDLSTDEDDRVNTLFAEAEALLTAKTTEARKLLSDDSEPEEPAGEGVA